MRTREGRCRQRIGQEITEAEAAEIGPQTRRGQKLQEMIKDSLELQGRGWVQPCQYLGFELLSFQTVEFRNQKKLVQRPGRDGKDAQKDFPHHLDTCVWSCRQHSTSFLGFRSCMEGAVKCMFRV